MKNLMIAILMFLGPATAVVGECQERESREARFRRTCTAEQSPRFFCEVHKISFEPVEVPPGSGGAFGEPESMASWERDCRYAGAREKEFPNAAPRSTPGGCLVIGEEKPGLSCACPICTAAEREWKWMCSGCPPGTDRSWWEPYDPEHTDTDLLLRIQQLRVFDEPEVADCLQRVWDRKFGAE